jgi:hypothetical protein
MATILYLSEFLNANTLARISELLNDNDDDVNNHYSDMCTSLIHLLGVEVSVGDIIQLSTEVYRNDSKMIWDGSKFVHLDSDVDEYGAVPPLSQLSVPQHFPIDYWKDSVTHNYLVPFDSSQFKDEILKTHHIDGSIHYFEEFITNNNKFAGIRRNSKGQSVPIAEPVYQVSQATFTYTDKTGKATVYTIYYEWINPKPLTIEDMNVKLSSMMTAKKTNLYHTHDILEDYVTAVNKSLTYDPNTTFTYIFDSTRDYESDHEDGNDEEDVGAEGDNEHEDDIHTNDNNQFVKAHQT